MGVLGLKRRMQKARVEVDVVSCNTLLNALAICGKWDEALNFLQVRGWGEYCGVVGAVGCRCMCARVGWWDGVCVVRVSWMYLT